MAPLQRKPVSPGDNLYPEESEQVRQRGRLSKPLTNTSTIGSSSLLNQIPIRRKSLSKSTYIDSLPPSSNGSREALRSHLFGSSSDLDLNKTLASKPSVVALIVSKYEKNNNNGTSTSAATLSPSTVATSATPQRPLSHLVSTLRTPEPRKSSVSTLASDEKVDLADLSTVSPTSSTDKIAGDLAPSTRRAASFKPGIATRIPNKEQIPVTVEVEPVINIVVQDTADEGVESDVRNDPVGTWTPPPRIDRPFTPADLEQTHLGSLTLGSLRIVNGRASPSPSELLNSFKCLPQQKLTRNASSVYESEFGTVKSKGTFKSNVAAESDWEDVEATETDNEQYEAKLADIRRAFSFKPGSEARFNQPGKATEVGRSQTAVAESSASKDHTALMAEEYMAELPTSPYAITEADSSDNSFQQLDNSFQEHEDKSSDAPPFVDETLDLSPIERRLATPESFFSVPEPPAPHDDKFMSAVELQPPTTPRRSQDESLARQTTKISGFVVTERSSTKSDSGYSSTTSLHAIIPPEQLLNNLNYYKPATPTKDRKLEISFPFRKAANNGRNIVVTPILSTNIPLPSSAEIEQASATVSTASLQPRSPLSKMFASSQPASPTKSNEKPRKKLVKQRRKSTADVSKKELVIQRLASIDCFNIPPITKTARASLAMRSEAIPELEKTYRTQDSESSVNASVLSLGPPTQNLRFPSPDPEQTGSRRRSLTRSRSLSRSRPIVNSRPKSWFGWQKDDAQSSNRQSEQNEGHYINLDDLGSVINALGNNPYDIAHGQHQNWSRRPEFPRSRTSPFGITNDNRTRSMMDDQTASKLSKLRRKSFAERENTKRHSFDDRGGIPGKMPNYSRLSIDAPPLPPMPSKEEINRRLSFRQSYLGHASPSQYQEVFPEDSVSIKEPNEPPPPPPHSPRPMYVDDQAVEDEEEEAEDLPPPPPCHSPRPVDITPQADEKDDHVWAAQANAWRERRMSAGEALRRSWHEDQDDPKSPTFPQTEAPAFSVPRKPLRSSTQIEDHPQYNFDSGHLQQEAYTRSPVARDDNGPRNSYPRQLPTRPHDYSTAQHDEYHYTDYVQPQQPGAYAFEDQQRYYENVHAHSPVRHPHHYQRHPQHDEQQYHQRLPNPRPHSSHGYDTPQQFRPEHTQSATPTRFHPYPHSASSSPRPQRYPGNRQQHNYNHSYNRQPPNGSNNMGFRPQPNANPNMYGSNANNMRYEQRPFVNGAAKTRDWLDMDSYGFDTMRMPVHHNHHHQASGNRMLYT